MRDAHMRKRQTISNGFWVEIVFVHIVWNNNQSFGITIFNPTDYAEYEFQRNSMIKTKKHTAEMYGCFIEFPRT